MTFPRRLLNEDEELVAELHPHWAYMGGPMLAAVVAVTGSIALVVRVSGIPQSGVIALVVVIVASVVWLAARFVRWATTDLVVTNQRVVLRSGVMARRSREIPVDRIMDLSITQTIFERLVGSGTLYIDSGAEAGQGIFSLVPSPASVQGAVQAQIERLRHSRLGYARSTEWIPDQIDKLADLCRRGIISRAEFEQKKAQLLDRL